MLGSIRRIDQTCEEGVCQLASHLYLQHIMSLHDAAPRKDGTRSGIFKSLGQGPSEKKMIRYYKWSIENHPSPVYGGGFKLAVKAFEKIADTGGGLKELLEYISIHRAFPPMDDH